MMGGLLCLFLFAWASLPAAARAQADTLGVDVCDQGMQLASAGRHLEARELLTACLAAGTSLCCR